MCVHTRSAKNLAFSICRMFSSDKRSTWSSNDFILFAPGGGTSPFSNSPN